MGHVIFNATRCICIDDGQPKCFDSASGANSWILDAPRQQNPLEFFSGNTNDVVTLRAPARTRDYVQEKFTLPKFTSESYAAHKFTSKYYFRLSDDCDCLEQNNNFNKSKENNGPMINGKFARFFKSYSNQFFLFFFRFQWNQLKHWLFTYPNELWANFVDKSFVQLSIRKTVYYSLN